jgi:hypothetical protein
VIRSTRMIFHHDRGSQGGFKWPSQHLDQRGAAWDDSQDGPMQPQVAQRFARRTDRKQSAFIEVRSRHQRSGVHRLRGRRLVPVQWFLEAWLRKQDLQLAHGWITGHGCQMVPG